MSEIKRCIECANNRCSTVGNPNYFVKGCDDFIPKPEPTKTRVRPTSIPSSGTPVREGSASSKTETTRTISLERYIELNLILVEGAIERVQVNTELFKHCKFFLDEFLKFHGVKIEGDL